MYKCPHCGKEIEYVTVTVMVNANIDDEGNFEYVGNDKESLIKDFEIQCI